MSFVAEHLDEFPTFLEIDLVHNGQLSSISRPTGMYRYPAYACILS